MFCPYFIVGVDLGVRAATEEGSQGQPLGLHLRPFFVSLPLLKKFPDK